METTTICMHLVSFRGICARCMHVIEILEMTKFCSCSIWKMHYVGEDLIVLGISLLEIIPRL